MNPAARQVALLDAQADACGGGAAADRVLMAGTTGAIPAVARLARVIVGLSDGRRGAAPGLDTAMADPAWDALEDLASTGRAAPVVEWAWSDAG